MCRCKSIRLTLTSSAFIALALLIMTVETTGANENPAHGLPAIIDQQGGPGIPFLPNFSYAGYNNGVGAIPAPAGAIIDVAEHGAVADDGKDDSLAVIDAINTANGVAGPVIIRFGAGRFRITEILPITRGHISLQGAGSGEGGTTLFFPRPLKLVDKTRALDELRDYIIKLKKIQKEPLMNINEHFSEYSWSGGLIWVQKPGSRPFEYLEDYDRPIPKIADIAKGERGGTHISLDGDGNLAPGDIIQIQWLNRSGLDAGILHALYGPYTGTIGSHHWSFPERPLVRQYTRVVSREGNVVEIANPLLHDINATIPAQIARWENLEQVGIEGLHLEFPPSPYVGHHLEHGFNGIYLTGALDAWVRDIRVSNADSGILIYDSANVTVQNIVSEGQRTSHYAVHMGNVHHVLAEHVSVFNPVMHALTFNTQATKSVYKDCEVWTRAILDQHAGANHQNLFDNITLHVAAQRGANGPYVTIYEGGGAGYWKPTHGAYSTTWNLNIVVEQGAYPNETVTALGLDEGPLASIVGLHGNRKFILEYTPEPYVEALNSELHNIPSLYDYQLSKRLEVRSR